jgi:hypothetical protein
MNKRIRELALQAWMAERTEKNPKYKKSEVTEYLLKDMEDFHKKFAELIIKECAKIAGKAEYSDTWLEPVEDAIKKHFGVEK